MDSNHKEVCQRSGLVHLQDKFDLSVLAARWKLCHSVGMKKSRKLKTKKRKRKRTFIRLEIVPLAEVLPLLNDTPDQKRKANVIVPK